MWLSEQCGKPAPIDMAGVHKAVEGGFGKGNGIALEVSLHEGRTMCEDYRESDKKDVEDRKATIFIGIRRTQNAFELLIARQETSKISILGHTPHFHQHQDISL